ncbi:MAG: hypothetical protein HZC01_02990 [Candidatus Kerfeldbacteria bacterium]|nr:hypothetical protein [Candidatus Kerfeldbacteria bacterium]
MDVQPHTSFFKRYWLVLIIIFAIAGTSLFISPFGIAWRERMQCETEPGRSYDQPSRQCLQKTTDGGSICRENSVCESDDCYLPDFAFPIGRAWDNLHHDSEGYVTGLCSHYITIFDKKPRDTASHLVPPTTCNITKAGKQIDGKDYAKVTCIDGQGKEINYNEDDPFINFVP